MVALLAHRARLRWNLPFWTAASTMEAENAVAQQTPVAVRGEPVEP